MSARVTSPEAKRIATSFAYCTTWLLVTTWPPLSQTKSRAGCHATLGFLAERIGSGLRRNHLHDRGRHLFENLDIGPLGVGERPAPLSRPGIRARPARLSG